MYPNPEDPPVKQDPATYTTVRGMVHCRSNGKQVRDLVPNKNPRHEHASMGSLTVDEFMASAHSQGLAPQQALQHMAITGPPQQRHPSWQFGGMANQQMQQPLPLTWQSSPAPVQPPAP
eukprot:4427434-Pyramimonas_sp.AAC.1